MWNHNDSVIAALPRSSNIAEGWHRVFHSLMGASNPTIWKFIDVLRKEQDITEWKMAQQLMRNPPPPRERRWVKYDEKLASLIAYDTYEETLDFLKCVGTLIAV